MSTTLLVGNWKMNLGPEAAAETARQIVRSCTGLAQSEVWLAPTFISIAAVSAVTNGTPVRLGAQNVHWQESGAFTGEISAPMLRESGCTFAIVGHSERRHVFGETNELVVRRALGALRQSLNIIYCVGETLGEREENRTHTVLESQLKELLSKLNESAQASTIIAYEPVWAIGTGKIATTAEIQDAHQFIAGLWKRRFSQATNCRIIYGGSVSPENFADILAVPAVSGVLIGGASLSAERMAAMVQIAERRR